MISETLRHAGMSEDAAGEKAVLFSKAYKVLPGLPRDRRAFWIPGRVEFCGKHTDYCGGRSLICAVERGLCLAATPRTDSMLRVFNLSDGSDVTIPLSPDAHSEGGHWSHYFAAVARRTARNFPGSLIGADLAVISDLPQAAGMSSSSACVVGTFLVLDHFNALRERREYRENIRSKEDLAGYLATMENGKTFGSLIGDKGVGTLGGSQDHTAILCGRAGHLVQYSYAPVVFERAVPLPRDYVFVVAVSGVVAEKTREALQKYNNVSLRAVEILKQWNHTTGRNDPTVAAAVAVDEKKLREVVKDDESLRTRLEQFIEDSNHIVPKIAELLAQHRLEEISELVDRSQKLADMHLGNQTAETMFLSSHARQIGAVAATAFGAGFGGSVAAIVHSAKAEEFARNWKHDYLVRFPQHSQKSDFFITRAGPPAIGPLL